MLAGVAAFVAAACLDRPAAPGAGPVGAPHERLAAAVRRARPLQPRLAGFPYTPGPVGNPRNPDAALVEAATDARQRLQGDAEPDTLALVGVASLVIGDVEGAVDALERAVAFPQPTASLWANLSAAHLERAAATDARRVDALVRAVDAGEEAIALDPRLPEASFNLALAREQLGYDAEAAWSAVAAVEPDSSWRAEAASHLRRLEAERLAVHWPTALAVIDDASRTARERSEACRRFPGHARTHAEEVILDRWGEAVLASAADRARLAAETAALIGACVEAATTDGFLADAVDELPRDVASPAARTWARALRSYAAGRRHFEASEDQQAAAAFRAAHALLRPTGSRFDLLVSIHAASLEYQARRLASAEETLALVEARAHAAGYPTIEARSLLVHGSVSMQRGDLAASHRQYARALSLVDYRTDPDTAVTAAYSTANTSRLVGDTSRGWRALSGALTSLHAVENPRRRYMVLYNASLLAEKDGRRAAAWYFQNGALRVAIDRGVPGAITEAYIRRAGLALSRGQAAAAAADLTLAQTTLTRVGDRSRRRYYESLLDAVSADAVTERDAAQAASRLTAAMTFFRAFEPADLPGLLLRRGRVRLRQGDTRGAKQDFSRGIDTLELIRLRTADPADQISLYDSAWELYGELVALHKARPSEAFQFAERGRARSLSDTVLEPSHRISSSDAIRRRLGPRVAVLQYQVLVDRAMLWVLRRNSMHMWELPIASDALARLVDDHRWSIEHGFSETEATVASRLHDALLGPAAPVLADVEDLVVVADGVLSRLAFAALRARDTGRRLVETHTIAMAPSSNLFLWASSLPDRGIGPRRAVVVGDPAFGRDDTSSLRRLPGAGREARAIGALYDDPAVLVGAQATKARFLSALPSAEVLHVGTHTVLNEEYPGRSELLFADDVEGSARLTLDELLQARGRVPAVAVLAACGTARGTAYRMEGVVSLARAFMEAGARQVVATLWDVGDVSAERLFVALHERLAAGVSAPQGLADVQRELIARTGSRDPRHWAPYVVVGGVNRD
jgi:CHAT domain-containing protein